jgi:cation diffusion facilitator CzcD-associated flavoprotein CzcO
VDAIVLGTGFEVTPFLPQFEICGANGKRLHEAWSDFPAAFLGTAVSGFPNLFTFLGPNTGLGHNSIVTMIEAQARYVLDALCVMRRNRIAAVDVKSDVQAPWVDSVQRRLQKTVWTRGGCNSWYQDERGRVVTLWPGSIREYERATRRFRVEDFDCIAEAGA